jgi:hypothetical protein
VFGRCKLETNTGGPDSLLVSDCSFDFDDMAQNGSPPSSLVLGKCWLVGWLGRAWGRGRISTR